MHRRLRAVVLVGLLLGLLGAAEAAAAAPTTDAGAERRSYSGTIDGAQYRVELPARWNGTLVL